LKTKEAKRGGRSTFRHLGTHKGRTKISRRGKGKKEKKKKRGRFPRKVRVAGVEKKGRVVISDASS